MNQIIDCWGSAGSGCDMRMKGTVTMLELER